MKFYITTPIYYVNDKPHIGHAYTTIAADILARFKRLMGYNVFFLTGTDEHGKKIEKAAEELKISPKELADKNHIIFKELWEKLDISYSKFIRTTDPEHQEAVKVFWTKMVSSGTVYKGKYVGWYCIHCESFFPSSQVKDGKCPSCGRAVDILEEESYFFSVKKFKEKLSKYIETSNFIRPEFRKAEVLNALKEIDDISISRSRERVSWGIPVPGDDKFVIYVWVDALINYVSALGYPNGDKMSFWPADVHFIGKDILKFHAIYWPMFLEAVGLEPPKTIFSHGWWRVEGKKMSKSLKNVVDPFEIAKLFGSDTLRFFMFREIPFGRDGDFSEEAIRKRYESDLAKDFGNLLLRVSKFAENNFPEGVRKNFPSSNTDLETAFDLWMEKMENIDYFSALDVIWNLVNFANKLMDQKGPWNLIKHDREKAEQVIYELAHIIKVIIFMLYPFCVSTCRKVSYNFGIQWLLDESSTKDKKDVLGFQEKFKISSTGVLFPKIEG